MRRLTGYVPPARRKIALVALAALTLLFLQAQLGNTNSAATAWLRDSLSAGTIGRPCWLALAALYTALMALPFVPGIELGLLLMLLLGREGIVAVYVCTQLALMISFVGGRCLGRHCRWLEARIQRGLAAGGGHVLRHRHAGLALALNLPGNAAVGGAGGIAALAGASRAFGPGAFCLTTAVATSPLPLLLWFGLAP